VPNPAHGIHQDLLHEGEGKEEERPVGERHHGEEGRDLLIADGIG
jgi:hypothetical protein